MYRKSAAWTATLAAASAALLFAAAAPARADLRVVVDTGILDVLFDSHPPVSTLAWSPSSGSCDYGPAVTVERCGAVYASASWLDDLDGYGEWYYRAEVGTEVWFPFVDPHWRPYLHGHWVSTTRGMTWVAYEPWGWIPHHYGRWVYFEAYGWGWIPGDEYGPAWVSWAVVDGHVGWAPLPPRGYRYPARRDYRYGGDPWRYGYDGRVDSPWCGIDFSLWIFVPNRYFYDTSIYVHVLPAHSCVGFFQSRRVLPIGPHLSVGFVKRITPRRVVNTTLHRTTHRIGGREVADYRPLGQQTKIRDGRALALHERQIAERGDRSLSSRLEAARRNAGSEWKADRAPGAGRATAKPYTPAPSRSAGSVERPSGRTSERAAPGQTYSPKSSSRTATRKVEPSNTPRRTYGAAPRTSPGRSEVKRNGTSSGESREMKSRNRPSARSAAPGKSNRTGGSGSGGSRSSGKAKRR